MRNFASLRRLAPRYLGSAVCVGITFMCAAATAQAQAELEITHFSAVAHAPTSLVQPPPSAMVGGPVGEAAMRISTERQLDWRNYILAGARNDLAGGRPDGSAHILVNGIQRGGSDPQTPSGQPFEVARDVIVETPPGFTGNPLAVPRCTMIDFYAMDATNKPSPIGRSDVAGRCTAASQIGVASVYAASGLGQFMVPVYNLVPPPSKPAAFGFWTPWVNVPNIVFATVNPENDYRVEAAATRIPSFSQFRMAYVSLWGIPHSPLNDIWRWNTDTRSWGKSVGGGVIRPFLSNPTYCDSGELVTDVKIRSWNRPERWVTDSYPADEPTHCEDVSFSGALDALPTQHEAGGPSGLAASMRLGFNNSPTGRADSPLRDAVVAFPEGVSVSPSAANGLAACSQDEIGLKKAGAPRCPDASKIGTVMVRTPLLEDPLHGSLFIAEQGEKNPFGTLTAVYLHVKGPGIDVKVAGRVDLDPGTGRVTTTFKDNPQLPFTELEVRLKSGSRAPLVLPATCGTFRSKTTLTPWSHPHSGPPIEHESRFDLKPSDGCAASLAARKFEPSMSGGSLNPVGGQFSKFVTRFTRGDQEQEFDQIVVKTPEGFAASLKGVPYCSESGVARAIGRDGEGDGAVEIADPSCTKASRIGGVTVGAGPGQTPFYANGNIYLAGPYRGAPLSLVFVVPAVAGPFDLGVQVVRAAINVDRRSAQITTVSDVIPKILEGVPLKIKDIRVAIDRDPFAVNPTSCLEKQIEARVRGANGKMSVSSERFQVAGCAALPFKPNLALELTGRKQVRTGKHPGVNAVVRQTGVGEAGIRKAKVTLPKSLALDVNNAQALCEFEDGTKDDLENHCPKGSIVGKAQAISPLLKQPLKGNVYFVKNIRRDPKTGNAIRTLPMIIVALRGEVAINLRGESDTTRAGRLVNTFDQTPDAPISRFDLNMNGGANGILAVTRTRAANINLCTRPKSHVADALMDGQNGKRYDRAIRMKTPCTKRQIKAAKRAAKKAARKAARG